MPGTWFLTSGEFGIEREDLKTNDLKEAIHNERAFMVVYLDATVIQLKNASKVLQESEEIEI